MSDKVLMLTNDFPNRIVVGANGAYWRDYGDGYSMCPVSTDNDPVQIVAVYVPLEKLEHMREYAQHDLFCSFSISQSPCDCGFDEVLNDYGK